MAKEKDKKKSADKTADKSVKDGKNAKGGKTAAEKTADKATATYKSLEKKVPKKKRGYLKAALNHATDKELEAVKRVKTKNSGFAGVLAITPLGWLGLDRFYIGDILRAITKILATVIIALSLCARFLPYFMDEVTSQTATDPGTPSASVQLTDGENVPEEERFTLPAAYVGIWDNKMQDETKMTIYLYTNGAEIIRGNATEKTPVVLAKAGTGSNEYYYFDAGELGKIKLEVKSGKLLISEVTEEPETPDTPPTGGDEGEGGTTTPDTPTPPTGGDEGEGGTTTPDTPTPPTGGEENEGGKENTETVRFIVALEGEEEGDTSGEGGEGTTPENPDNPPAEGGDGTEEPPAEEEQPDPFTFVKQMDEGDTVIYRAGIPESIATIVVIALCAFFGLYLLFDIFLTPKKAKKDNYYKVMKVLAPEVDE